MDVPTVSREFRERTRPARVRARVSASSARLTAEKRVREIVAAFADTRAWAPEAVLLLAGAADAWLDLDQYIEELGLGARRPPAAESGRSRIRPRHRGHRRRAESAMADGPRDVRPVGARPGARTRDGDHGSAASDRTCPRSIRARGAATLRAATSRRTPTTERSPSRWIWWIWRIRSGSPSGVLDRMRRCARALGDRARQWWEREHTVARMVDDYERVLERARITPPPAVPAGLAAASAAAARCRRPRAAPGSAVARLQS